MKYAVIDGGYEEHMRRIAEEAEKGMMEILGYVPNGRASDRLEYISVLCDQRRERARRRYLVERRGNCVVLMPVAFKKPVAA